MNAHCADADTTDPDGTWDEPCPGCGFVHPEMTCPAKRVGLLFGDKYRLTALLGVGGMGVVYAARHEVVGRRFAIKLLHPSSLIHPSVILRFRREAQVAGSIENEHIAAITDFGTTQDGAPYLVMAYLEGQLGQGDDEWRGDEAKEMGGALKAVRFF